MLGSNGTEAEVPLKLPSPGGTFLRAAGRRGPKQGSQESRTSPVLGCLHLQLTVRIFSRVCPRKKRLLNTAWLRYWPRRWCGICGDNSGSEKVPAPCPCKEVGAARARTDLTELAGGEPQPARALRRPVLQVKVSGRTRCGWSASQGGLEARRAVSQGKVARKTAKASAGAPADMRQRSGDTQRLTARVGCQLERVPALCSKFLWGNCRGGPRCPCGSMPGEWAGHLKG